MSKKGNAIVLSYNVSRYISGNYHQDLITAAQKLFNCYVYGPGIPRAGHEAYPDYNENDTIDDVFRKSGWKASEVDIIICGTHWDKAGQTELNNEVNPHPNINLANVNCQTVYFLNKEYMNLQQKLDYAYQNEFDIVATVLPKSIFENWNKHPSTTIKQSHFGIDFDIFHFSDATSRKYDLSFTGSLHEKYTQKRRLVKNRIFNYPNLPTNRGPSAFFTPGHVISPEFRHLDIYWAEWSRRWSRGWNGRSLLPTGAAYGQLMRDSHLFFNSLSASGIFGTRFFELMASGSINLCPHDDYYGILEDGENCVMYNDVSELKDLIDGLLRNPAKMHQIRNNALQSAQNASYENRLKTLLQI